MLDRRAEDVMVNAELLTRLRERDVSWSPSGVAFAASAPRMMARYDDAVRDLAACIKPAAGAGDILHEGGVYHGCWLESTGTINAELLSRFFPEVAKQTFLGFAAHQRADGLLPYKLTAEGPAFSQIQIVSPLARSVWTHYLTNGRDRAFLGTMYEAMAKNDAWLARWRDTRGTGGVEAFCCYDTGHDRSARFWHVPDSPFGNDPKRYQPDHPTLPFVAPDLTANVACQRRYLALISEELGEDGGAWRAQALRSEHALFEECWDDAGGIFYDRDRNGEHVRVQSDVLLRVLACEIGDDELFATALGRYLLNTRKFFARFPFTSIALDDPRFDHAFGQNSWCGPTNFLSIIRAAHAFEAHGRYVELTWVLQPILSALFRAERFGQTLSPFSGEMGFTEQYSPAILCLLDFVERLSGIMPRPDGTLWFTGLVPREIEHRDIQHETAYARTVGGTRYALVNTVTESVALRDGASLFRAPRGVRVVTDDAGALRSLIGMSVNDIEGTLTFAGADYPFRIAANEQLDLRDGGLRSVRKPGLVPITY